ncbi:MAG: GNAT family N-acetyltransferase [Theionarchaea archaeon]|nr:GNAT family N-acetyltransferase [Theionarchaea archaeon]
MKCITCGKKATKSENLLLVIGLACEECVPRGKDVSFQILPAKNPKDLQFVLHFLEDLFGETKFIEFGRCYDIREMEQLVAIDEKGRYIGLAVYTIEQEDPALMTLLTVNVDESFFRRGVASALLKEVKRIAIRRKISKIRVPISNDDLISYVFYHRRGFRLSGIDINLCVKSHGDELEGLWKLPLRDELYLVCNVRDGQFEEQLNRIAGTL